MTESLAVALHVAVILPRLAAMASANNQMANETKKADIARQLFDAYSAMSCCCILRFTQPVCLCVCVRMRACVCVCVNQCVHVPVSVRMV